MKTFHTPAVKTDYNIYFVADVVTGVAPSVIDVKLASIRSALASCGLSGTIKHIQMNKCKDRHNVLLLLFLFSQTKMPQSNTTQIKMKLCV